MKMASSLNNKKWEEFFISGKEGLFDITSTSSGIDKNKLFLKERKIIMVLTYSFQITKMKNMKKMKVM